MLMDEYDLQPATGIGLSNEPQGWRTGCMFFAFVSEIPAIVIQEAFFDLPCLDPVPCLSFSRIPGEITRLIVENPQSHSASRAIGYTFASRGKGLPGRARVGDLTAVRWGSQCRRVRCGGGSHRFAALRSAAISRPGGCTMRRYVLAFAVMLAVVGTAEAGGRHHHGHGGGDAVAWFALGSLVTFLSVAHAHPAPPRRSLPPSVARPRTPLACPWPPPPSARDSTAPAPASPSRAPCPPSSPRASHPLARSPSPPNGFGAALPL